MFDCGGDGVVDGEWGVYNNSEMFYLEVGLVQGLKRAIIIKVMIEWYSKMGVSDSSGEHGVFSEWEEGE